VDLSTAYLARFVAGGRLDAKPAAAAWADSGFPSLLPVWEHS
jgi:hypothetical protein